MAKSSIEWTDATWNPVTGCTKISPGCKHCYAERLSKRLMLMGAQKYRNGFELSLHPDVMLAPLSWKQPRSIFVNSMSDLFHDDVPIEHIQRIFEVINLAHWHRFQVLTKRSHRLRELSPLLNWPPNLWMGVSVENTDYRFRIDHLRSTKAALKFLSLEPLLGPLPQLNLQDINWVIVGGESGPGARRCNTEWVIEIRDQCLAANVPFFFKQWGGVHKKRNGRLLEGLTWDQTPERFPLTDSSA